MGNLRNLPVWLREQWHLRLTSLVEKDSLFSWQTTCVEDGQIAHLTWGVWLASECFFAWGYA